MGERFDHIVTWCYEDEGEARAFYEEGLPFTSIAELDDYWYVTIRSEYTPKD